MWPHQYHYSILLQDHLCVKGTNGLERTWLEKEVQADFVGAFLIIIIIIN